MIRSQVIYAVASFGLALYPWRSCKAFSTFSLPPSLPSIQDAVRSSLYASSGNVERLSGAPIKRVAIIGGGIAGLTLAHALQSQDNRKLNVEAHVFDSRETFDKAAGAGVQINGGLSVLRQINPHLGSAVARASCPVKQIRSRAKPWSTKTSNQRERAADTSFTTLIDIDLADAVKRAGKQAENALTHEGELQWCSIMRGELQRVLIDELPSEAVKRLHLKKTLCGIEGVQSDSSYDGEDNRDGIMCHFTDGAVHGPFDLVVGCDGIKSAVKEYVEEGEILNQEQSRPSIYSGLRIMYAVAEGKDTKVLLPARREAVEFHQYFGDGAYALASTYGDGERKDPTQCAFIVFRDDDYVGPFNFGKKGHNNEDQMAKQASENVDWKQDNRMKGDAKAFCIDRLQQCNILTNEVGAIIDRATRFFELGVYFHNPLLISGWNREVEKSRGRYCVLAGDAAHAMPPFLGQGANQAVQDAFCLANHIRAYNFKMESDSHDDFLHKRKEHGIKKVRKIDIRSYLQEYESMRWWPTTEITIKSVFLGYLEVGGKGLLSGVRDVLFSFLWRIGIAAKVLVDGATPRI